MVKNVVKLKLDIVFKKFFSENPDLLQSFISTMLDIPNKSIKKIIILNSEVMPDFLDSKFSRMDLRLLADNDKVINIEIQVKNEKDYSDRALFYWSKLYTAELQKGEVYQSLKKSITINILNFNMFKCPEYHSHFTVMEKDRHEILSDKCAIHFLELKKVNKRSKNKKELWLNLIDAETKEDYLMLENENVPEITKAVHLIYEMSEDEKLQERARIREKMLHDEASAMYEAEQRGIEKGKVEGKAEILEKLKLAGLLSEDIEKVLRT